LAHRDGDWSFEKERQIILCGPYCVGAVQIATGTDGEGIESGVFDHGGEVFVEDGLLVDFGHTGAATFLVGVDYANYAQVGGHAAPVFLPGIPGQEALHANLHAPVVIRGNVLQHLSGCLLLSAYRLDDPNIAHIFASRDQGRSWVCLAPIAEDFNETFLYQTESGALVAFMRRWSESTYLHRAHSEDGGQKWSAAELVCRGNRLIQKDCRVGGYC
jgi:hypothetical protein